MNELKANIMKNANINLSKLSIYNMVKQVNGSGFPAKFMESIGHKIETLKDSDGNPLMSKRSQNAKRGQKKPKPEPVKIYRYDGLVFWLTHSQNKVNLVPYRSIEDVKKASQLTSGNTDNLKLVKLAKDAQFAENSYDTQDEFDTAFKDLIDKAKSQLEKHPVEPLEPVEPLDPVEPVEPLELRPHTSSKEKAVKPLDPVATTQDEDERIKKYVNRKDSRESDKIDDDLDDADKSLREQEEKDRMGKDLDDMHKSLRERTKQKDHDRLEEGFNAIDFGKFDKAVIPVDANTDTSGLAGKSIEAVVKLAGDVVQIHIPK